MGKGIRFFIGTLSRGGAERVVSNITMSLPSNLKKQIILYGSNSEVEYPYMGELKYLDTKNGNNYISKFYLLIKRVKEVKKIKKAHPEDTTISFLEYPNLINLLTRSHGKSIISVRNHMTNKHKGIKGFFWRISFRLMYNKADLVVAISEGVKRDLIDNYSIKPEKVKVIYNPCDNSAIKKLRDEQIDAKYRKIFKNPVIITSGRMTYQKGQWHLIRAFSAVKEKIPNAKLIILGRGELQGYLEELAKGLNVYNDVEFLGFQENPFKYIHKSKLFVFTSLYEGFGNVLTEALACNIPVISTDCLSGPREILAPSEINDDEIDYSINEKRCGILTPVCDGNMYKPNDPLTKEERVIADRIIRLLNDSEMWDHFSKKSSIRSKDFDEEILIKQWESILTE